MRPQSAWFALAIVTASLAVASEAVATELRFVEKRSHTNVASAGVGGLRNQESGTITLTGVSGTVTKAYLYWQGPTNSTSPTVNASIQINENTVVGSNIGFGHDCNWGFLNSQAYRADVTSFVTGNGTYVLTGFKADSPATENGANINGASLIVFFNGGSVTSRRDVYLFDGNDTNTTTDFDPAGWSATLSGINYSTGTTARLEGHVSDGQDFGPGNEDNPLFLNGETQLTPSTFDGNTVPSANNGPNNNGSLWDIRSYSIESSLSPGSNTLQLTAAISFDCLALVAVVVDVAATTNQTPVASADQYVVEVGQTLSVGAPGVLANDTDADGDPLTAVLVTSPLHAAAGGFTLNADGSFTYTPAAGFTGTDNFTYRASDGSGSEATSGPQVGFVTIKVNDPSAQTATVQNFSSTCEVTLRLTFNHATSDTFVVRPTDFNKHWHCHLFNLTTGQEVSPKSVHGAPGITLQIDGNPADGDLQRVPAQQSATFEARGSLCHVFNITDGNYKALCLAENSITDPTVDPTTGQCPDATECLGAPIRTYIAPAQEFSFGSTGGSIAPGDQCPSLSGDAGGTGCPFAIQLLVTLNKRPLANVAVRVFSRSNPDFLQVTGGDKNPPSTLYPKIYEANQGAVGACVTDTSGRCTVGIPAKDALLLLVKFTNPSGNPDYDGSPGTSSDFKPGSVVASKGINIKR